MSRQIEVYPYGPDAQRHFEELSAAGAAWGEASDASRSVTIDWPDDLRLPVVGDGFSYDWITGYVRSVSLHFEEGEWYVILHVGPSG